MTDQAPTGQPKAAPASEAMPVTLDAVESHLRRRAMRAEQEALMLAITVRDLAAEIAHLRALLAEKEAHHADV